VKALKILHNSSEFMPYVIFIAAPGMEQLKHLYGIGRSLGSSSRNLTVSTKLHKVAGHFLYAMLSELLCSVTHNLRCVVVILYDIELFF
jgi:hypothetical protein